MDLRAGLQRGFGGSYRIERELGGGGMSRVFLAAEAALDRKVVIKVLAPELMLGVSAERFKREIALSAKLQHPHIVAVLNAGETTDPAGVWCVPYYTMPFVDGESLRGRMRRTGTLPIAETLSVLRDVARALAYAHERGVVHRDIKPDNVLITGDSAVVTDFGVAKAIVAARDIGKNTTLTDAGGVIGTPAYMSPEQAKGSTSVDHRADIFGFGVMAYEMLTGRQPFTGDTAEQLTESRLTPPKDVSELRPETPPLLAELVMRCMEHDPHRRPPTASHVVHVLDNVTSGAGRQPSIDTLLGSRPRFLAALTPRARKGGALALAALVLLFAALVITRLLGVGPAASLFAALPLLKNERVLVGDLRGTGAARDTTLSTVLTEALRTDLGQSTSFSVMTATALRDALRRMQRDVKTPVDGAVAREIATREGVKAFVDGDILSIGAGFVISVRLVETSTGETLMAVQERANSERDVLGAIDRVTRQLRERAGDTFKQIHDTPTLEQVTTPSMDALRAYVQGVRALSFDGNWDRGRVFLEEAIALDTAFSMAYRKLAAEMNNRRSDPVRVADYLAKAFRHRDHLTETERYLTIGTYYAYGPEPDNDKAIAAYESLADLQPTNAAALNNASTQLTWAHRYERAERYITRAVNLPDAAAVSFNQLGHIGVALGDTVQVRRALNELEHRFARNSLMLAGRFEALYALGQVDSALALALRSDNGDLDLVTRGAMVRLGAGILAMRGRTDQAHAAFARASVLRAQSGDLTPLLPALDSAWIDGWLRGDTERARRTLDRALAAHPPASVHHAVRPYTPLVRMLALVGRTDEAKAIAALFEKDEKTFRRFEGSRIRHGMAGDIALAEHKYADAAREYFLASEAIGTAASGRVCFVADAAHAFDLGGSADSAIAVYRRYLETGDPAKSGDMWEGSHVMDATWRAYAYRRLGELYEAKGDTKNAVRFYSAFVDLWKDADPELQPRVAEARRKLAAVKASSAHP